MEGKKDLFSVPVHRIYGSESILHNQPGTDFALLNRQMQNLAAASGAHRLIIHDCRCERGLTQRTNQLARKDLLGV